MNLEFFYSHSRLEKEYGFTFPDWEMDINNFYTVEHIDNLMERMIK